MPEYFKLYAHTISCFQIHKLRINEILSAVARRARSDELRGNIGIVAAEQIAGNIKLMHKRIGCRHIACNLSTARRRKVAVLRANDQRNANRSLLNDPLQVAIILIIAAHKADLQQTLSRLLLGLHNADAALRRV